MAVTSFLTRTLCAGLLTAGIGWTSAVRAADDLGPKVAGGLTVYLGVVPAEIVKGLPPHAAERPMHGRIPKGPHEYHLVAAVFEATSGARVADAAITAQVAGLGLSGAKTKLEPMSISNTITYGAFVDLPGRDLYTIQLAITRPAMQQPVLVDLKFDHRNR